MTRRQLKGSTGVVAATLLWSGVALATPTPAQICTAAKQTAAGYEGKRELACYAKYTKRGASFDVAACVGRAQVRFARASRKAEFSAKGNPRGCATPGDAAAIETLAENFVAAVMAALPPGAPQVALATPTPAQVCAAAKQTAAGYEGKRELACYAKYTKRGASFDVAACVGRAQIRFARAIRKAEFTATGNQRGCATTGDAAAIETLVETFVAAVMAALPPGAPQTILTPTAPSATTPISTPTITPLWTPTATLTTTPADPPVDNGDGTITDNQTGLMWEKKSDDGSLHDQDNRYTWSSSGTAADGTVFTEFLAALNTPPCFAGYCDWRLPSEAGNNAPFSGPRELESLLAAPYPCNMIPCAPPLFNTGCAPGCTVTTCSCTQPEYYWATPSTARNPLSAWTMNFFTGGVEDLDKTFSGYVRAVRSVW